MSYNFRNSTSLKNSYLQKIANVLYMIKEIIRRIKPNLVCIYPPSMTKSLIMNCN